MEEKNNLPVVLRPDPSDLDPIVLIKEDFEFKTGKTIHKGEGKICFFLHPKPHLEFELVDHDLGFDEFHECLQKNFLSMTLKPNSKEYFFKGGITNYFVSEGSCLKGRIHDVSSGKKREISSVKFFLPNFFNYKNKKSFRIIRKSIDKKNDSNFHEDRILLQSDKWEVIIEPLPNIREIVAYLKRTEGYQITHICRLISKTAKCFSIEQLKYFFEAFSYFLSFAIGYWTSPILPIEEEDKADFIWECLIDNLRFSNFKCFPSWFDEHHIEQLIETFPLFLHKWEQSLWREAFKSVIYWYIMANTLQGGLDGAIIMAQAALEEISWIQIVQDKEMLSEKGFKDLWVSDRFRLLFSLVGLPLAIPDSLCNLKKLVESEKWEDGPYIITQIRNDIVHPKKKYVEKINGKIKEECWRLSLWYLEMVILSVIGYKSTYANRLKKDRWFRQVEEVPWCRKKEKKESSGE